MQKKLFLQKLPKNVQLKSKNGLFFLQAIFRKQDSINEQKVSFLVIHNVRTMLILGVCFWNQFVNIYLQKCRPYAFISNAFLPHPLYLQTCNWTRMVVEHSSTLSIIHHNHNRFHLIWLQSFSICHGTHCVELYSKSNHVSIQLKLKTRPSYRTAMCCRSLWSYDLFTLLLLLLLLLLTKDDSRSLMRRRHCYCCTAAAAWQQTRASMLCCNVSLY